MTDDYDVPNQYEEVRSYARRWAEGTLRQAKRYREAYKLAFALDDCWERLDSETLTWEEVIEASETAWVEGHLLVVAAHQMENWRRRMLEERGDLEPGENDSLNDLRNTLEHLDEALFVDGEPMRNPASKWKNWSLDKLPRTPALYLQSKRMSVLGLLKIEDLEQAGYEITEEIADEIEAPAVDSYIQRLIDERLGR